VAFFIRKRPPERCHPAEVEVAEFLAELDDGWLVRWGFTYQDNKGALREGDFLISGPNGGVLVLEVKAGPVALNPYTGLWTTSSGDDPSFQLDEEWSSVVSQIERHKGSSPSVFVGRSLGTPHVSLPSNCPNHHGIPRELIFDRRDLRKFAQTFEQRMSAWGARTSRVDREIFEAAFGSEASPKSIRHFVDDIDRLVLRHTEASYGLLDQLADNRRFLVSGGPGTGKTWLAVELARRWAGEGKTVLLLTYNLGLTEELRSMIERMEVMKRVQPKSITVMAWEDLVRQAFLEAGLPYEPPSEKEALRKFFEDDVPALMQDMVVGGQIRARFDALVVDEGQDHDTASASTNNAGGWWPAYFSLLKRGALGSSIAVFHDTAQRPSFRAGSFEPESLVSAWGTEPVRIRLGQSLRYTQQIFKYLNGLSSPALQGLRAGLGSQPVWHQGNEVEEISVPREESVQAVASIVERWINQGWARAEQILILSRRGTQSGSSLGGITNLSGFPLVTDFRPERGSIGFGSVNRAKGLDRLAVIVVDFAPWGSMPVEDHFPFFMGVSRARQLLAVVGVRPNFNELTQVSHLAAGASR